MKRLIFAVTFAAIVLLWGEAPARAQESEAFPSYIQVNGRAEREVTPDRFTLSILITEHDSKGRISVEEQQRAMIAALQKVGIDPEKQLKVADNASELYRKKQSLATTRYELKLNSSEQMISAWQRLSELNLKRVQLLRAEYSALETLRQELRREAILNARQTAEELATAIGQQIGKCFYIVDWNNDAEPRFYDNAVVMRSKAAVTEESVEPESEPLDFRSIRLSYSVQTKFILE